jgi:hypothetical protein
MDENKSQMFDNTLFKKVPAIDSVGRGEIEEIL